MYTLALLYIKLELNGVYFSLTCFPNTCTSNWPLVNGSKQTVMLLEKNYFKVGIHPSQVLCIAAYEKYDKTWQESRFLSFVLLC